MNIECHSFNRDAPQGHRPVLPTPDFDERVSWAVQFGFAHRPNILFHDMYDGKNTHWQEECTLECREYDNCYVGPFGAVLSPRHGIVCPSPLYHPPLFSPPAMKLDRALNLCQYGNTAYYHWTCEIMPKLSAWEDDGQTPILVGTKSGFVAEYLQIIGIDSERLIDCPYVFVDKLLWPTYWPWTWMGEPPREPLVKMRQTILDRRWWPQREKRAAVVRRDKNDVRDSIDHETIAALLRKTGFQTEIVNFGSMQVTEQIALSSSLSVLVGSFGADLSNALWMPTGSAVVEIHSGAFPPYTNYWHLCSCIGLNYRSVTDCSKIGEILQDIKV